MDWPNHCWSAHNTLFLQLLELSFGGCQFGIVQPAKLGCDRAASRHYVMLHPMSGGGKAALSVEYICKVHQECLLLKLKIPMKTGSGGATWSLGAGNSNCRHRGGRRGDGGRVVG